MKQTNKILLLTAALVAGLGTSAAFAQDFSDFGGFDDSFGDDTSTTSLTSASKLEANGSVSVDMRAYVDTSNKADGTTSDGDSAASKIEMEATPSATVDLSYSGNKSDMELSLCVDKDRIQKHPEDVIDELLLRGRFGDYFTLEAGKMKLVWGKGDKLHVLDNFNADDYSDFIIPDYLDRRISTPMVRGLVSLPFANLNIEGVYTPFLPVDRFATTGRWTPAQVKALTSNVKNTATTKVATAFTNYTTATATAGGAGAVYEMTQDSQALHAYNLAKANAKSAGEAYMLALTNANALSSDPSVIYPDLSSLKYGQYGGRATWTLGMIDMGFSYYNGWYKQPSFNAGKLDSFVTSYLAKGTVSENEKFLAYDKKQTFGLEASSIIWHFNVRGEFAYNLTDDTEGTNPWVHNNSIAWLGGFDIDLPFWNANLNIQETGTYILHDDECRKNTLDVDYAANAYTNNKIVCNFTTSFLNGKIAPEVTAMYGIENGDLVVMPKLALKPDQNLTLEASGMYIWCRDDKSEFSAWKNNSFVNIGASIQF